jgi:hypothetical protein
VSAGDECPNGSAVFQTTLRSGPKSVGRRVLVEMPEPFGPRNRDQPPGSALSAEFTVAATPSRKHEIRRAGDFFFTKLPSPDLLASLLNS